MLMKFAAIVLATLLGSAGVKSFSQEAPKLEANRSIPASKDVMPTLSDDNLSANYWTVASQSPYPLSAITDKNDETYVALHEPHVGENKPYIQFDLTTTVKIYDISIQFLGDNDFLTDGYWTWSNNGSNYMTIESFHIENAGEDATVKAYGINASYLRLYGVASYNNRWVSISEIKINQGTYDDDFIQGIEFHGFTNSYFPTDVVNIETGYNNIVDLNPETYARTAKPNVGDYIQFDFKEVSTITSVQYQNIDLSPLTNDRIVGAKIQYNQAAPGDAEDFVDADISFQKFLDGYEPQLFDFRSNPIQTNAIRFVITDNAGWAVVGDFAFNMLEDSEFPVVKVTPNGATDYYLDSLVYHLFDGSDATHCWYNGYITAVQLDLRHTVAINDVYFKSGKKNDGGDTWTAQLQYSLTGEENSWTDFGSQGTTVDWAASGSPIYARYVRALNKGNVGWMAVSQFIVNRTSHVYYYGFNNGSGTGALESGLLANIMDNDPTTSATFNTPKNGIDNAIVAYYPTGITLESLNVQFGSNYIQSVELEYADVNGVFRPLETKQTNLNTMCAKFDYRNNPIEANYIRIIPHNTEGQVEIIDLGINHLDASYPIFTAVGNFQIVETYGGSLDNVLDGDYESNVWFDFHFDQYSYFELDYTEDVTINNIYFLQGGRTYDSYIHRTEGNNDIFSENEAKLEYKSESGSWVEVNADLTAKNVFVSFETPISARYIRVTYVKGGQCSHGMVIREFGINIVKANPVIVDWATEAYYEGDNIHIKGYYYHTYAADFVVTYRQGENVLLEAPTQPGTYSVTISSSGNAVYNAVAEETKTLHIYDTVEHFLEKWEEMKPQFCSYFGEGDNPLKQLIRIYDNDLKVADKATIAATSDTGAYATNIGDAIEYAKDHIEEFGGSNNSSIFTNVSQKSNITIIIIVALSASIALSLFIAFKQRGNKHE